ncbi:MAG: Smr/MutS family protein [Pyrinomonadaceae bacterium]
MTFTSWLKQLLFPNQLRDKQTPITTEDITHDNDIDPFNPFPDPVTIEITDVIDLHTIQPRDVKRVVEEYLLEAHAKGFRNVRVIHGKGIGAQRELVRAVLARTSFVEDWTDAPPDAGGWGATIVRLKSQPHRDGGAG